MASSTTELSFSHSIRIRLARSAKHVKNTPTKVQDLVSFPSQPSGLELNGSSYTLVSVNAHKGNVGGGHCYSLTCVDGNWIEFNDQTVGNLCAEKVEANSDAYILVYEENTATTPAPTQTPTPTTEIEEGERALMKTRIRATTKLTIILNCRLRRFHRSQQRVVSPGNAKNTNTSTSTSTNINKRNRKR